MKICPTCRGVGGVQFLGDTPINTTDPAFVVRDVDGPWTCPLCWGKMFVTNDVFPVLKPASAFVERAAQPEDWPDDRRSHGNRDWLHGLIR